jgi:hypothetical protein
MSIENPNNLYSENEAFEEANKMKKLIDEGKASNYDEAEKIINQENKAFEEANKMSEKIESGEAKDYNEAERLVEIEEQKTLLKQQIKELVANAEIILNSKEYQDPEQKKEQAKLLEEYRNKIAQLLNLPQEQIYLLDLIKNNENIDKVVNESLGLKEKSSKEKEEEKNKQELDEIIKEVIEGNITIETIMKIMTNPKKYTELISYLIQDPKFQEYLKKNPDKIKVIVEKLNNFINKEKQAAVPEDVEKAKGLIKKEEGKGKESLFKKAGGWETILSFGGFSLIMFLLLIFIGEFKIWEKATGWNLDVGGGKGKK